MGSLTPIPDVFVAMDDETQAQTVPSGFVVVLAPTAAILMDAPAGPPGKDATDDFDTDLVLIFNIAQL